MKKIKIPYNTKLVLLSLFLLALWFGGGFVVPGRGEDRLWKRVRDGQGALWRAQTAAGVPLSKAEDRLETGFIGIEWSEITTTLGEPEAKRTSCNPLWALQCLDWFDELGLEAGDRIAIYSSASFPGLLFSVLAAAESRDLDILLAVSLGASTWGANLPEFPWPAMYETLRGGGFLKTAPAFYTLGGGGERGGGMSSEATALFRGFATRGGTPLVVPRDLRDAVRYKMAALRKFEPKLLVGIGGSNANLGDSELAAEIPNGLLLPGRADAGALGDGVIAEALRADIPVLNLLGMRKLAHESGIPWDAGAFSKVRVKLHPLTALAGLAAFAGVLILHRRWEWADDGE